jgi:hypothetical protein
VPAVSGAGVLAISPVAGLKATPDGSPPHSARAGVGKPVVVICKLPLVPTKRLPELAAGDGRGLVNGESKALHRIGQKVVIAGPRLGYQEGGR